MTTLELKLDLPARLARGAQVAGLLTPEGTKQLLQDAMRRRAKELIEGILLKHQARRFLFSDRPTARLGNA